MLGSRHQGHIRDYDTAMLELIGSWERQTENKCTNTFYEIAKCERCCDRKKQGAEIETKNDRPVLPSLGWLVGGEGQEEAIPGRRRRTEPSVSADKSAARQEQRRLK